MTSLIQPRGLIGPARLAGITQRIASDPAKWFSLVEYRADHRWYRRLNRTDDYEVWLLSWLPGQRTGFHDHDVSAGAFAVALGCLRERSALGGRPEAFGRTLDTGAARSFGPGHVHDVSNDWTSGRSASTPTRRPCPACAVSASPTMACCVSSRTSGRGNRSQTVLRPPLA